MLRGRSLPKVPLVERRNRLAKLFGGGMPHIKVVEQLPGAGGEQLYLAAVQLGAEGIVGKRLDSTQPGCGRATG